MEAAPRPGLGLELRVAAQIADAHGGELNVESNERDGRDLLLLLHADRSGVARAALSSRGVGCRDGPAKRLAAT